MTASLNLPIAPLSRAKPALKHPVVRRYFATKSANGVKKQKLVILGTGWAACRTLKDLNYRKYDVTVVSPRNHFLFTPLLCSTTTGVLEFRSVMESIRSISGGKFNFFQGAAQSVDFAAKKVICVDWKHPEKTFDVEYDKLVISVGADNNTFGIAGVKENVFFLKEAADARAIRTKVLELLEEASIPTISPEERRRMLNFVVVGGGPTGVEFAAELSDFFWETYRNFPNLSINDLRITLLEAGDTILSAFSKGIVESAMKNFKRQGIDMKLQSPVAEVKRDKVILKDGSQLDYGIVVWSTGVGPRKFVKDMNDVELDRGRLVVDPQLRLKGHTDVFALGDCATLEGKSLPATAQVANQQGAYLAKLLNGKLPKESSNSQEVVRFQYVPLGLLAYIGSYKSALDTGFFSGTGWLEFLAWRSVYLSRLGSWKQRLMVPYNWLKTMIWGRDVSHF